LASLLMSKKKSPFDVGEDEVRYVTHRKEGEMKDWTNEKIDSEIGPNGAVLAQLHKGYVICSYCGAKTDQYLKLPNLRHRIPICDGCENKIVQMEDNMTKEKEENFFDTESLKREFEQKAESPKFIEEVIEETNKVKELSDIKINI